MSNNDTHRATDPLEDRKALEALVVDNPDLERLEALLDQFNIFEAVGAVRQELRHSDFLAFLLDPQQNHGLGDVFAKRLLQKALSTMHAALPSVTPIDIDVWSFDRMLVLREWQNIDILLLDDAHRLAVIIENKIDSSESPGQLQRYYERVQRDYPDWRIIALYLTPEGEIPSHENYLPVDYGLVCELIEELTESRASTLGAEVLTLITHYTRMLRRYVVNESEIAELSRRIYQKHRRALDLIYEHRPDQQAVVQGILQDLIQQTPGLIPDHITKRDIRFTVSEWDVPTLSVAEGWTPSGRILLFNFDNSSDSLKLKLIIGPGPYETRQKLFDLAHANQPPLKPDKSLHKYWNTIFNRSFLTKKFYERIGEDEGDGEDKIRQEISKNWEKFIENDLPAIRAGIKP